MIRYFCGTFRSIIPAGRCYATLKTSGESSPRDLSFLSVTVGTCPCCQQRWKRDVGEREFTGHDRLPLRELAINWPRVWIKRTRASSLLSNILLANGWRLPRLCIAGPRGMRRYFRIAIIRIYSSNFFAGLFDSIICTQEFVYDYVRCNYIRVK